MPSVTVSVAPGESSGRPQTTYRLGIPERLGPRNLQQAVESAAATEQDRHHPAIVRDAKRHWTLSPALPWRSMDALAAAGKFYEEGALDVRRLMRDLRRDLRAEKTRLTRP